jgi:hypothetical protein
VSIDWNARADAIADAPRGGSYTAVFPLVKYAKAFAERISGPGYAVVNVVQKGRTVTFDDTGRYGSTLYDWLEIAGYVGSTIKAKATVNGVRAPIAY